MEEIIKDSIQFFYIARGSLYEAETQLYVSFDLQYIAESDLKKILTKLETVRKLLNGLIRYYSSESGPSAHNPQPSTS